MHVANIRTRDDLMHYMLRHGGRMIISSDRWGHKNARKIARRMAAEGLIVKQPYQHDRLIRYTLPEKTL